MRDLSFSQLCLLSLFGTQAVPLRPSNYTGVGNFDNDLAAVLLEVGELYRDNLLMPQGGGGGIPYGAITSIVPANTRLQGASHELYQRAGLVRLMDDPKTQDIAAILRRAP